MAKRMTRRDRLEQGHTAQLQQAPFTLEALKQRPLLVRSQVLSRLKTWGVEKPVCARKVGAGLTGVF